MVRIVHLVIWVCSGVACIMTLSPKVGIHGFDKREGKWLHSCKMHDL